jgi:hypothetical protein
MVWVVALYGRTEESSGTACLVSMETKPNDDGLVDDGGTGNRSKSHVLPLPQWGMDTAPRTPQGLFVAGEQASPRPKSPWRSRSSSLPRGNLNVVPLQELDSKSSLLLSAFIRPFCSCSSRAALLETPRELCFRISSKNLPVLRHRHPRLNISSGSLPLAAALVRHLDPRSNEIALRLFLPRKPA